MSYLTEFIPPKIELFKWSDINLFEIDDAGMILYYRVGNQKNSNETAFELIGRNFFEEALQVENIEELRQRVKLFLKGNSIVEDFKFVFRIKNQSILAKIMLMRIAEGIEEKPNNPIIIDIRKLGY